MKNRRVKIVTRVDRPHITHDILSVLRNHDVGIMMMEVYTYVIYIKIPPIDDEAYEEIVSDLYKNEDIDLVEEIDLIAFEERDIEMKQILDIIPQGVMVLDEDWNIKYSNTYMAERIIRLPVDNLKNTNIRNYIDKENLDKFFLNSKDGIVRNEELEIQGNVYVANLTPIISSQNTSLGHILSANEVQKQLIFDNHISFKDIIGESNIIYELINQGKRFARSESPIFIVGEQGTGKELMARSIHDYSSRGDKPFVTINCRAIPEQILELELFGSNDKELKDNKVRKSLIELAEGGTLFIDEIDGMSTHAQAKLLNILQEKRIKVAGGENYKPVDVRIISTSSEDLNKLVEDNLFLPELYYRLNIFSMEIPPLRDRKEDIPILFEHIVENEKIRYGKRDIIIQSAAMDKLFEYSWPGNIRELKNVVERAMAISKDDIITEKEILVSEESKIKGMESANISLNEVLGEIEREIIVEALGNNKSIRGTARSLDVTHTLLINRIKKYKILDSEWK